MKTIIKKKEVQVKQLCKNCGKELKDKRVGYFCSRSCLLTYARSKK